MRTISEQKCFDGVMGFYAHPSRECGVEMRFAVYLPPHAAKGRVPAVTFLAGLTCNEETFMAKAGAQRVAAELGLILVAPDTSPRGAGLPGEAAEWDFGVGAGFYIDATEAPWSRHYRMHSYVTKELPELVARHFPARADRQGIFGHSMGGHGALVAALRNPGRYRSVSAFAPIGAPSVAQWGEKAFSRFLGADRAAWAEWDASQLIRRRPIDAALLVDQGTDDKFLAEQLRPELLEAACRAAGQRLRLRRRAGYDHSYYFIASFVEEHLRHHARLLGDEEEPGAPFPAPPFMDLA
jgi:S-formylglutathione hydrolase